MLVVIDVGRLDCHLQYGQNRFAVLRDDWGHDMQKEEERQPTQAELFEQFKREQPWKAWLLVNGRKLAFAAAMLIALIGLILFGGTEKPPGSG